MRRLHDYVSATFAIGGLAMLAAPAAHAADICNRLCLEKHADQFVAALTKRDPSGLPLAKDFVMTQDLEVIGFDQGVWKTATGMYSMKGHTQYVADVAAGQIGYMGILKDGDNNPAFLSLRLKVNDGLIKEAEMLVTHRGEGSPFVPHGYLYREAPYIRDIPLASRSSRKQLLAATDHFWKVSTTTHNGLSIPYTLGCVHFHNGSTSWERPLYDWERFDPKKPASEQNIMATPPQEDGRVWTCARETTLTSRTWDSVKSRADFVDEERGLVMSWVAIQTAPGQVPTGQLRADGTRAPDPEGFYHPPAGPGLDGWPGTSTGPATASAVDTRQPYTLYKSVVFRIIDGKIDRQQVFQRNLALDTRSPWAK